MALAPHLRMVV
jgi:hypothetical protein